MAIRSRKLNKKILTTSMMVIIAVALFLFLYNPKSKGVIPSSSPASKAQSGQPESTTSPQKDKQVAASTGFASPPDSNKKAASSGTLVQPSGTFVSNHKPSLSRRSAPSTEQSVCNTTPGAKCSIEFEKDNGIKVLAAQTTDSSGAAYWSWDVKQAGLTEGNWKITAIATQDGQTKTAQDSQVLEVQP